MESASEEKSAATEEEDTAKEQEDAPSGQEEDRRASGQGEDGDQKSGEEPSGEGGKADGDLEAGEEPRAEGGKEGGDQESGEGDGEGDEDEDEGSSSSGSIARAIEDVSALPGETVNDQDGRKIGEVKEIYGVGDDETPMWVTIESATGLGRSRDVFVPLARIKRQKDEIRVPYSYAHIHESPEVESGDELSEEDDRALRVYYAIGLADQELVADAQSYASQVPDEEEPARKIDESSAEGPVREIDDAPPAERAAEAYEKQKEEEGDEHRQSSGATADDIFEEDGAGDSKDEGDKDDKDEDSEDDKTEGSADDKDEDEKDDKSEDSEDTKSEERPKEEAKQEGD
jgi:hypothetical protein